MSDSTQPTEFSKSGCKDFIQASVFAIDILLLLFSIWGLQALNDYYIPWQAISKDGDNVFVRPGPDKDYAHVRKLSGNEPVLIVDEVYDWYVLSRDPLEMVRQDTVTETESSSRRRLFYIIDYISVYPPWHIIAIALLWFWPRIRVSLTVIDMNVI